MSASTNAMTGPDAAVVVKVNFEGITRRAKMHLREMVPRVLEEQVCYYPGSSNHISDLSLAFLKLSCVRLFADL